MTDRTTAPRLFQPERACPIPEGCAAGVTLTDKYVLISIHRRAFTPQVGVDSVARAAQMVEEANAGIPVNPDTERTDQ